VRHSGIRGDKERSTGGLSGLLSIARVQPGEGERVALMLLLSLVLVGGVVITGLIVGRSLFLSGLPASAIPLRFIVPPLLLVAATAAYSRRISRGGQVQALVPTFVVMAGAVLVGRLLTATPVGDNRVFLLLLYSLLEIAAGLSMILFWTIAGSIFDPREARRLFSLISSGSAIAMVAFGLFLGELARRRPPESLMVLVVASLLLAAVITRRLLRFVRGDEAEVPRQPAPDGTVSRPNLATNLRESLSSPLVVTLAGIALVISLVANLTDYQLDLALKDAYGDDGSSMIGFLSRLRLVAGVVAIAVQLFVAGRLMERFGVLTALLTLPSAVGLGSVAILASGAALWAVAIPRAAVEALRYSVNDSAFNLLYLPLAPESRSRAKALIDGILKPPLVALLGLSFLVVDQLGGASVAAWSVPVLAFVVAWVILLKRAEKTYVRTLAQSILLRRLDPSREQLAMSDETSRRVLAAELANPDPTKVIHALSLLGGTTEYDWSSHLVPLLGHPSADVRVAVLDLLGETPRPATHEAVRQRLDDTEPAVRAAAVRAFGVALGQGAVAELARHLDDPDPDVRAAVVVTLVREGGLAGFLHAGGPLHAMLGSPDPSDRREGARILGALAVPGFYHPLLELIADADRSVRLAAIDAGRRIGAPELVPVLEAALDDPSVRRAAVEALLVCAGSDLSLLGKQLLDTAKPRELRSQVARSLAGCGPAAGPILLDAVDDPDDALRSTVLASLLALRDSGDGVRLATATLAPRLDAELKIAYERWLGLLELRRAGALGELLGEALEVGGRRDRDRLLDLLDLLYPDLSAAALRGALDRPDDRRRADAIELVDNVVLAGRAGVVAYLGGSEPQRLDVAEKRFGLRRLTAGERLHLLCASPDGWQRACALDAMGRSNGDARLDVLEQATADPDHLVATTARAALARLGTADPPIAGASLASPSTASPKEMPPVPLAPLEQVLFLKQVPLFGDIPGEEMVALLPIVEQVAFGPGETIIKEGDDGDGLFVIVEGEVAIDVGGVHQTTLGPRSVIGELAILSGEPRAATCTALGEVVAMGIRRDPFLGLLRDRPEVSLGVIRTLLQYVKRPAAPPAEVEPVG
jgi:HEAT repeat protein